MGARDETAQPGTWTATSIKNPKGTTVISDWLVFRVTVNPGHTFLDRLVEAAKRQKTPKWGWGYDHDLGAHISRSDSILYHDGTGGHIQMTVKELRPPFQLRSLNQSPPS